MTFATGQDKNEGVWKDDQFIERRHVPPLLIANEDKYNALKSDARKSIVDLDLMRAYSNPEAHKPFIANFT